MTRLRRGFVFTSLVLLACRPTAADTRRVDSGVAAPMPAPTAAVTPTSPLAVRHKMAATHDSIALDSCARLDREARPQGRVPQPGEAVAPPREGSWTVSRVAATPRFTIELPVAASALRVTPDSGFAVDSFPDCRYSCILSVQFLRDSLHEGAARYVDRVRRQVIASGEDGADWAFGPSRQLSVDGTPAVLVDVPCGDCTSASLYLSRADTLVEITYSVDDREGYQPGIACRFARIAQSFQWP